MPDWTSSAPTADTTADRRSAPAGQGDARRRHAWPFVLLAALAGFAAGWLGHAAAAQDTAASHVQKPAAAATESVPGTPPAQVDESDAGTGHTSESAPAPGLDEDGIPAGAVAALVLALTDGDTLDTDAGTVRLHGIDTPELGTPFADEATARLETLAPPESTVYLWRRPGSDNTDRYGRLVRTVFTSDGQDVGQVLVRAGLATAYVRYSDAYVEVEVAARTDRAGIWGANAADDSSHRPTGDNSLAKPGTSTSTEPWNTPGPDLDCSDIGRPVTITGPDYHRLDGDGDGRACESYR